MGAITHPKFICADCRQRIERKKASRAIAVECST
jgi:uncharacterized protein YlaI